MNVIGRSPVKYIVLILSQSLFDEPIWQLCSDNYSDICNGRDMYMYMYVSLII